MYQDATTVLVQQLGGGGGSRITTARHVSFFPPFLTFQPPPFSKSSFLDTIYSQLYNLMSASYMSPPRRD